MHLKTYDDMDLYFGYGMLRLCGGENRVKGRTGMVHLPQGDVREAPMTERSVLAGETKRVFESPI